MTKTRHILGLSGGKDSAALAVHMNNKHPEIDVEYFFTDTSYELDETYKFLDKLKTRLDKPIHYIKPLQFGGKNDVTNLGLKCSTCSTFSPY